VPYKAGVRQRDGAPTRRLPPLPFHFASRACRSARVVLAQSPLPLPVYSWDSAWAFFRPPVSTCPCLCISRTHVAAQCSQLAAQTTAGHDRRTDQHNTKRTLVLCRRHFCGQTFGVSTSRVQPITGLVLTRLGLGCSAELEEEQGPVMGRKYSVESAPTDGEYALLWPLKTRPIDNSPQDTQQEGWQAHQPTPNRARPYLYQWTFW